MLAKSRYMSVTQEKITYPENISSSFESFVKGCLQFEVHERMTIMELQIDVFIRSAECRFA